MVGIMGMIFFLSHQPDDFSQLPQFAGSDKILHVIAYGLLAGTFLYGLHPFVDDSSRAVTAIIVVMFCLLFGISDEYHQSFIPGRQVSVWDVIADGVGATLVVAWWLTKQARKGQKTVE
jgi:VanZ family protein